MSQAYVIHKDIYLYYPLELSKNPTADANLHVFIEEVCGNEGTSPTKFHLVGRDLLKQSGSHFLASPLHCPQEQCVCFERVSMKYSTTFLACGCPFQTRSESFLGAISLQRSCAERNFQSVLNKMGKQRLLLACPGTQGKSTHIWSRGPWEN